MACGGGHKPETGEQTSRNETHGVESVQHNFAGEARHTPCQLCVGRVTITLLPLYSSGGAVVPMWRKLANWQI